MVSRWAAVAPAITKSSSGAGPGSGQAGSSSPPMSVPHLDFPCGGRRNPIFHSCRFLPQCILSGSVLDCAVSTRRILPASRPRQHGPDPSLIGQVVQSCWNSTWKPCAGPQPGPDYSLESRPARPDHQKGSKAASSTAVRHRAGGPPATAPSYAPCLGALMSALVTISQSRARPDQARNSDGPARAGQAAS